MTLRRRSPARAAALVTAVVAILAATPAPGWAADGLVAASPADGAALATAPSEVELTLAGTPDLAASHLGAADDSRAQLTTGELSLAGPRTVRQELTSAARGTVVVAYHIVFTDGGEAYGSIRFSVGTGVAPPTTGGGAQQIAESAAFTHGHSVDPFSAVLLVVDLAVLAGAGLLLILRPRRSPQ